MTDPHVHLLRYRLRTDEGLHFNNPPTLDFDAGRFTLHLENDDLTVTMQEHHAGLPSARAVVEQFLEAWEVSEALKRGRRSLWFEYGNLKLSTATPQLLDHLKSSGSWPQTRPL
jgi:hypothetical protein